MKHENVDPAEVESRIARILQAYLEANLPEADKSQDPHPSHADIREFGVESVDAMELFAEIEREFGVQLGDEGIDFSEVNSLAAITSLVVKKL